MVRDQFTCNLSRFLTDSLQFLQTVWSAPFLGTHLFPCSIGRSVEQDAAGEVVVVVTAVDAVVANTAVLLEEDFAVQVEK